MDEIGRHPKWRAPGPQTLVCGLAPPQGSLPSQQPHLDLWADDYECHWPWLVLVAAVDGEM